MAGFRDGPLNLSTSRHGRGSRVACCTGCGRDTTARSRLCRACSGDGGASGDALRGAWEELPGAAGEREPGTYQLGEGT